MGWGGKRPGAGRKKGVVSPARVLAHPSVPPSTNVMAEIEEFDAPDDLALEERQVWMKQAPHAFRMGTLTRATAMSFERYCKVVVLERNEAKSSGMGGANHRGLLKQINDYEKQFLLTACGRSLVVMKVQDTAQQSSKLGRFRG